MLITFWEANTFHEQLITVGNCNMMDFSHQFFFRSVSVCVSVSGCGLTDTIRSLIFCHPEIFIFSLNQPFDCSHLMLVLFTLKVDWASGQLDIRTMTAIQNRSRVSVWLCVCGVREYLKGDLPWQTYSHAQRWNRCQYAANERYDLKSTETWITDRIDEDERRNESKRFVPVAINIER